MTDTRYARWEAIAKSYATNWKGEAALPTDTVEYPAAIMSLLSDAQEEMGIALGDGYLNTRYNDRINAAKLMLCNMKEAAREAERAALTPAVKGATMRAEETA